MTDTSRWQDFGRAITLARNARKWSQRRLAAEAGVSPTTLGALERGETDPASSRAMPAIAQALDWPADIAYQHARGKHDPAALIHPPQPKPRTDFTSNEIDQLAGDIAELDEEDREAVRNLVRRLRNR
ncbi:multiprotein-bridging factor 1 family protein [Egicoccus sp. AB-alg6-2]